MSLHTKLALALDIEVGDTLLFGRFKNIPEVVEEIGTDENGQPTVNGKKLLACRIKKLMTQKTAATPKSIGDKLQVAIRHLFGGKNCLNGAMKARHELDKMGIKSRLIFDSKKLHFGLQPIDNEHGLLHLTGDPRSGQKLKFEYNTPEYLGGLQRMGVIRPHLISEKFASKRSTLELL